MLGTAVRQRVSRRCPHRGRCRAARAHLAQDETIPGLTFAETDYITMALEEQPEYPPRLREIVLQSADELFRASSIVDK